jgi:hypothetical protein
MMNTTLISSKQQCLNIIVALFCDSDHARQILLEMKLALLKTQKGVGLSSANNDEELSTVIKHTHTDVDLP